MKKALAKKALLLVGLTLIVLGAVLAFQTLMPRTVPHPVLTDSLSFVQGQPIEADVVMANQFDYRYEVVGVSWTSTENVQMRYEEVPQGSSLTSTAHSSPWIWDIRWDIRGLPSVSWAIEYKITFERESAPFHPLVAEQGTILNLYSVEQERLPPNQSLLLFGIALIGIGVAIGVIGGAYKSVASAYAADYPGRGRF
jgi:uncharacterized protein YjeT (DUF2065 family)